MSTPMTIVLIAAFIGLCLPAILKFVLFFVVAPIKRIGKPALPVKATIVDVSEDQLSPAERQVIADATPRFAAMGLRPVGIFQYQGASGDLRSASVDFDHPTTGETASLLLITGNIAQNQSLYIRSRLTDDEELVTTAGQAGSYLPRVRTSHGIVCSWVNDPAVLVELHRRRLAKMNRPAIQELPYTAETYHAYLAAQYEKNARRWPDTGYGRLDPTGQTYVLTGKGAFLAVWKLLPPLRDIIQRRRDRDARSAWQDTGMDSFAAPPLSVATATVVAAPAAPKDAALDYRVRLAAGAIAMEWRGPVLIVRAGNPTIGEVLLSQWLNLLSLVFFVLLLSINWALSIYTFLPTGDGFRFSSMFWVIVAILAWDVWLIVAAMRKVRGVTTLTVAPGGIQFQNAPLHPRDGDVARQDIQYLNIRPGEQAVQRKAQALTVTTVRHQRITLLHSPDIDALDQARLAIRRALLLDPS